MTKELKVSVLLANVKLVQKESIRHGIRDPCLIPTGVNILLQNFFVFT